jgi:hypothetical protein
VAHCNIKKQTVETRISLRGLTNLLTNDIESFVESVGQTWDNYFRDDIVLFELPANPYHEESMRNYEHFEDWFVERESLTHTVLGFDGEWKVIADSRGEVSAYQGTESVDVSAAPDALRGACEGAVKRFPTTERNLNNNLSGDTEQQLRDLGYV